MNWSAVYGQFLRTYPQYDVERIDRMEPWLFFRLSPPLADLAVAPAAAAQTDYLRDAFAARRAQQARLAAERGGGA